MSIEQSIEFVRKGEFRIMAITRLDPRQVDRLMQPHEDTPYIPLEDFFKLLEESANVLKQQRISRPVASVTGVSADAVRQISLALLRVPAIMESLTDNSSLERVSEEETRRHIEARREAARIAEKIQPRDGPRRSRHTDVTFEDFRKLVSTSTHPDLTEKLLLATPVPSQSVQLATGEAMPSVAPAPKALPSSLVHEVQIKVRSVDEDDAIAQVCIVGPNAPSVVALDGLLGLDLPMTFNAANRPVVRGLIGAQLIGQAVKCTVNITRALREGDRKLTRLSLRRFLMSSDQRKLVNDEAQQLLLDLEYEHASSGT